ncbi:hypothetical protein Celaphus_00004625 [Cervus elaphus hippelaphus]|uniref:HMG box domain-containing protein n=1 Tax=Cervus elaphus hippelaphus TaxID=46360 RepID=A0A212DD77_CEREH|nr:hypothetical protein Celaphus_00004625 [Cervus elaphus hippelaphus]
MGNSSGACRSDWSLGFTQERHFLAVATLWEFRGSGGAGVPWVPRLYSRRDLGSRAKMWDSSKHVCSPEQPRTNSLSPSDRKQRKNHTSKLQELALLLPVTLKTGTKKLTKQPHVFLSAHSIPSFFWEQKEVLLHVLQYIHYLQSCINQGVETIHFLNKTPPGPREKLVSYDSGEEVGKESPNADPWLPAWTAEDSPQERQTRAQNPRRCLALEKPEKLETPSPDQKGGNVVGTTTPPRCLDSCNLPKAEASSSQGDRKGGRRQLTWLDVAENSVHCDISKSPLALGPPQITNEIETDPLKEILGLSPSLFSSPGKLLPEQILEDGSEYLTQALFEEILRAASGGREGTPLPPSVHLFLSFSFMSQDTPPEVPKDPSNSQDLCQSSVSLDHCYLSLSENSKVPSSAGSEDTDTDSVWRQQQDTQGDLEGLQSSSDDGDYTWTPTRRVSPLPTAGRKARKGRASRRPSKSKGSKKAPGTPQMKKKCVNGFIMFCRMNRKQYIRACPGTASTAATKELAQLWRVMTLQERKPYCTKARRFSRQHNRIVKQDSSSSEDEDWETPKPFYQLLAEKARGSPDPVSPESPQQDPSSTSPPAVAPRSSPSGSGSGSLSTQPLSASAQFQPGRPDGHGRGRQQQPLGRGRREAG